MLIQKWENGLSCWVCYSNSNTFPLFSLEQSSKEWKVFSPREHEQEIDADDLCDDEYDDESEQYLLELAEVAQSLC